MRIKIEVGKFYKSNWFTVEEPEWGYFHVIKCCSGAEAGERTDYRQKMPGYLIEECNPWGGHWTHWRPAEEVEDRLPGNCIEVPALVASKFLFRGYGEPRPGYKPII